jgi:hypothetical protein
MSGFGQANEKAVIPDRDVIISAIVVSIPKVSAGGVSWFTSDRFPIEPPQQQRSGPQAAV